MRRLLADAIDLPVLLTTTAKQVPRGSAILGAVAGEAHRSIKQAMSAAQHVIRPSGDPATRALHAVRCAAFTTFQKAVREIAAASTEVYPSPPGRTRHDEFRLS